MLYWIYYTFYDYKRSLILKFYLISNLFDESCWLFSRLCDKDRNSSRIGEQNVNVNKRLIYLLGKEALKSWHIWIIESLMNMIDALENLILDGRTDDTKKWMNWLIKT